MYIYMCWKVKDRQLINSISKLLSNSFLRRATFTEIDAGKNRQTNIRRLKHTRMSPRSWVWEGSCFKYIYNNLENSELLMLSMSLLSINVRHMSFKSIDTIGIFVSILEMVLERYFSVQWSNVGGQWMIYIIGLISRFLYQIYTFKHISCQSRHSCWRNQSEARTFNILVSGIRSPFKNLPR